MNDAERQLGTQWFEEVWNKKRRKAIAEMMSPDAIIHDAGTDSRGPDGFHLFFDRMLAAFSELSVKVLDTIAENDRIWVRWLCSARHSGDGFGIPSTGKPIEVTGITILRIANGKIVEGWQNWDMLGLMQQIQNKTNSPTYVSM